jgi:hypothetical protein
MNFPDYLLTSCTTIEQGNLPLALLEFLMRGSRTILCHLALTVVEGTLQSLVPATPTAIGAYFLHHVYRNINNETLDSFDDIQHFYHSGMALGSLALA